MLSFVLLKKQNLFRSQLSSIIPKASFFNYFHYGNVGMGVLRKKDLDEVHHSDPGHDPEVWKKDVMFSKTFENNFVPSVDTIATGKERLEHLALKEGQDPYFGLMNPLEITEKGTKTKPIEVLSGDVDRIVGCSGYDGHEHALTWLFITEDGHKYWEFGHNRCPECGNTYKLRKVELPYPTIL